MAPLFGLTKISVAGGKTIYLKRQVRGLNYDELAISANGNLCTPADSDTDYIYREQGPFLVFYSVSNGQLTIYNNAPLSEPRYDIPGVKVVVKTLSQPDYFELERSFAKQGITKITEVPVDLNSGKNCGT